jgi:hypothetical protein
MQSLSKTQTLLDSTCFSVLYEELDMPASYPSSSPSPSLDHSSTPPPNHASVAVPLSPTPVSLLAPHCPPTAATTALRPNYQSLRVPKPNAAPSSSPITPHTDSVPLPESILTNRLIDAL